MNVYCMYRAVLSNREGLGKSLINKTTMLQYVNIPHLNISVIIDMIF